jgi:hypothetical protein
MGRVGFAGAVQPRTGRWNTRFALARVLMQPLSNGPVRSLLMLGQWVPRTQMNEPIETGETPIDPVAKSGQVFGRDGRHDLFEWINLGDGDESMEQVNFRKRINSMHA